MKNAPAFQFFPADFLVGTADLSAEEVGVYIRLLCFQWAKGGLPDDDRKLAALAGCKPRTVANVRAKFKLCEDGQLRNGRLEKTRLQQAEFRHRQTVNGAKGGRPSGKPGGNPGLSSGETQTKASAENPGPNPDESSSFFSLQSSDNTPLPPGHGKPVTELPKELQTDAFKAAWAEWRTHRKEKGEPLKPTTEKKQLETLTAIGVQRAIVMIQHTIFKGWTGLREPGPEEVSRYKPTEKQLPPVSEPDGWKIWLNKECEHSPYAANGEREAKQWSDLPREVQIHVRGQMRKDA